MKPVLLLIALCYCTAGHAQLSPGLDAVARRYFHLLPEGTDPQEWVKQLNAAPAVVPSPVPAPNWLFRGRFHNPRMIEGADTATLLFGRVNTYHKNISTGATVLTSSYYTYIQEYSAPGKDFTWKQWKRYCKEIVQPFLANSIWREQTSGTAGQVRVYTINDRDHADPHLRIRFGKNLRDDWFLSLEYQYNALP
ncbi:hypothetical protein [Flaviaesturariibacter amylovorans]|uniref:Uncharacterized protein n=1 Tax=Flaviaesturariibacter amylovorans TaxID=1084520 RepID=A0ABP8GGB3_9BACT